MWQLFRRPVWKELPFDEIKKRARLLVIDDLEFPYKALFERDGYTIEKWSDVEDLPKLEGGFYDIILLDLQGVGREQSGEQGLGVLRHLRQVAPAQVIIAYSSADWSLKYQEFFQLADAVLTKSSDYVDFKRKVDQLLRERFSLGFYLNRVRSLLDQQIQDPDRADRFVQSAIRSRSSQRLERFLQDQRIDPQVVSAVLNVVRTAIAIATLWKS